MQTENDNNQSQQVTLNVSIEEANLILEGLGLIPFAKVYTLVNKLQQQASQQLKGTQNEDSTKKDASTLTNKGTPSKA